MGAADAWGTVSGVCVADAPAEVPPGVELLVGDHPIPGPASFEAGRRVLEVARESPRTVALVSGGGSALCEHPLPGVPRDFLAGVTHDLAVGGRHRLCQRAEMLEHVVGGFDERRPVAD